VSEEERGIYTPVFVMGFVNHIVAPWESPFFFRQKTNEVALTAAIGTPKKGNHSMDFQKGNVVFCFRRSRDGRHPSETFVAYPSTMKASVSIPQKIKGIPITITILLPLINRDGIYRVECLLLLPDRMD
jgi:hypothetical protein